MRQIATGDTTIPGRNLNGLHALALPRHFFTYLDFRYHFSEKQNSTHHARLTSYSTSYHNPSPATDTTHNIQLLLSHVTAPPRQTISGGTCHPAGGTTPRFQTSEPPDFICATQMPPNSTQSVARFIGGFLRFFDRVPPVPPIFLFFRKK